jgi:hypothetical protein
MAETPQPTSREATRLAVRRLTRVLAALAVAATAAFGAAAASATKHGTTTDPSSTDVVVSDYGDYGDDADNGFGFGPPGQALSPGTGGPLATSGGS